MKDSKLSATYRRQAQMLANRSKKCYQHFRKRYARQNIDCFRIYDWDIPEIRAVVDWYAGHLVVAEYTRKQSTPEWLPVMGNAVAEALGVDPENVHLKERRTGLIFWKPQIAATKNLTWQSSPPPLFPRPEIEWMISTSRTITRSS